MWKRVCFLSCTLNFDYKWKYFRKSNITLSEVLPNTRILLSTSSGIEKKNLMSCHTGWIPVGMFWQSFIWRWKLNTFFSPCAIFINGMWFFSFSWAFVAAFEKYQSLFLTKLDFVRFWIPTRIHDFYEMSNSFPQHFSREKAQYALSFKIWILCRYILNQIGFSIP